MYGLCSPQKQLHFGNRKGITSSFYYSLCFSVDHTPVEQAGVSEVMERWRRDVILKKGRGADSSSHRDEKEEGHHHSCVWV